MDYIVVWTLLCMAAAEEPSVILPDPVPGGGVESSGDRIIGGRRIPVEQAPWIVSVVTRQSSTSDQASLCGGSIISSNVVLTAAHCCTDIEDLSLTTIRSGSDRYFDGGMTHSLDEVNIFPDYNARNQDGDICLLHVNPAFRYSRKVQAVSIARFEPGKGDRAMAAGWGVTETGSVSPDLRAVNLTVLDRGECAKMYEKFNNPNVKITEKMTCAAAPRKDSCQGDSGGPLTSQGTLVAVTSWGIGCARPDAPGVYANIIYPPMRSFIRDHSGV